MHYTMLYWRSEHIKPKLRSYIKRRVWFSYEDQLVDRIADETRIIIFTMIVIDIFFYSIRCVSHMSLDLKQSRDSNISFIISVITIICIVSDLSLLFLSNRELKLGKLKKQRKDEETLKKNDRIMQLRLKLMRENAPFLDPSEHLNQAAEDANNQQLKTMAELPKESNSFAAVLFFTEGIKLEHINDCKYYNSYSLVKLIIVEPIYVTLQLFPKAQILALVAIQLTYFTYFCNLAFRKRVFVSWVNPLQIFCNEFAVLLFLMVGLVFEVGGGINSFSVETAAILQYIGMGGLFVSCLTGTLIIVISVFRGVIVAVRNWKLKKMRETYEKEFELEPFWLKPPYCDRLPEAFKILLRQKEIKVENGSEGKAELLGEKEIDEEVELQEGLEEDIRPRRAGETQARGSVVVDDLSSVSVYKDIRESQVNYSSLAMEPRKGSVGDSDEKPSPEALRKVSLLSSPGDLEEGMAIDSARIQEEPNRVMDEAKLDDSLYFPMHKEEGLKGIDLNGDANKEEMLDEKRIDSGEKRVEPMDFTASMNKAANNMRRSRVHSMARPKKPRLLDQFNLLNISELDLQEDA
jgi:hypothetical protein